MTAPLLLGLMWLFPQEIQSARPFQPPVFQAEVTSVFVDVFVLDGRTAGTLGPSDFVLKDNGVAQSFDLVPADSLPIRLILAFDTSGSVRGAKLERLQASAQLLLDRLRPQDEAGIVSFSEELAWPMALSDDREKARRSIASLHARGGTAVYDALFSALLMPRSGLRTLVVLFSDGEDNTSWLDGARLKQLVERFNALIYVVAAKSQDFNSAIISGATISELRHIQSLKGIAEVTGGSLIEVKSLDRLGPAFSEIMDIMKRRYVLRYEPSSDPAPGWHRLDVEVRSKKARVRARSGYWAAPLRP